MHKDYFEGMLQLRNPTKRIKDFINDEVNRNNIYVCKIVPQKEGLDYFMSSQRFLNNLGKKLKSNFVGELKTSAKLFSRNKQTGKEIYRVNVFFRMLDYKVGQKIKYRDEDYKIMSIGKKITAKNLKTGKSRMFTSKELI